MPPVAFGIHHDYLAGYDAGVHFTEASIDHGNILGLTDDDHTQYILHSIADAANDFLVASGADTFVRKTLAETGAILEGDIDHGNLQGLDTGADHSYIDQDVTTTGTPTFTSVNDVYIQTVADGNYGIGGSTLFEDRSFLHPILSYEWSITK